MQSSHLSVGGVDEEFECDGVSQVVDMKWCFAGCGKRSNPSSLYCSGACFVKEMSASAAIITNTVTIPSISISNQSPALSATGSDKCPSPLFLASSPTSNIPHFTLGSFLNRPKPHSTRRTNH
jgi:hypothetical protein